MRLLHVSSLELKTFFGDKIPKYAILSHTWAEDEFLFKDLEAGLARQQNPTRGLSKVLQTCKIARKLGLEWIWIDTCCIDKSSSSELSEAINSMFKWYQRSTICLVFLEDLALGPDGSFTNFGTSRWFRRGWTLQELIAPHRLLFFDGRWNFLASSNHISRRLASITGVAERIFTHCYTDPTTDASEPLLCKCFRFYSRVQSELREESVATKMHWAAKRGTTREEDTAYCLMGLFDINMPLLYGEGGERAFYRLQKEIISSVDDQSILLWHAPFVYRETDLPLLAKHPSWFSHCGLIRKNRSPGQLRSINMTPGGLEMEALLVPCSPIFLKGMKASHPSPYNHLAVLACHVDGDVFKRPAIFLTPTDDASGSPVRAYHRGQQFMSVIVGFNTEVQLIYEGGIWDRELSEIALRGSLMRWPWSVRVDFSKSQKQQVLLSPYESHSLWGGCLVSQKEQVSLQLKGRGHGSYRLRLSHPPLPADMVLADDAHFSLNSHRMGADVFYLGGILFFWRDDPPSGFVIGWGTIEFDSLEFDSFELDPFELDPVPPGIMSWFEPWESLTGLREFDEQTAKDVWCSAKLEQLIMKCCRGTAGWEPRSRGSILDVQVQTSIDKVSFLDVAAWVLTVEVE